MRHTLHFVLTTLFVLLAFCSAQARTTTQGTIEFGKLLDAVNAGEADYHDRVGELTGNIKGHQAAISKLKADFSKARSSSERAEIKARILKETSRLFESWDQYHAVTIARVETVLPNLEKMSKHMRNNGVNGKMRRQLEDPVFVRQINNLYGNLASLSQLIGDNRSKAEIARLLKNNELRYSDNTSGQKSKHNRFVKNVDQMADSLRALYAQTVNANMVLAQRKEKAKYAIQLGMYALEIGKIRDNLPRFSAMVLEIPEIAVDDFLEESFFFDDEGEEAEEELLDAYDTDVDSVLTSYHNGIINNN